MPATRKMRYFAEQIAFELNINEPDYEDFDETSEFIEDNKSDYYRSINEGF